MTVLETGAPVLEALVSFDCEIEQIQEVGTHIFMCRTVAIQQSQHEHSLVYFNRLSGEAQKSLKQLFQYKTLKQMYCGI